MNAVVPLGMVRLRILVGGRLHDTAYVTPERLEWAARKVRAQLAKLAPPYEPMALVADHDQTVTEILWSHR